MALEYNPATGLFEDTAAGTTTTTATAITTPTVTAPTDVQVSGGLEFNPTTGLFETSGGNALGISEETQEDISFGRQALGAVGGIAKEIVLSPFRVAASPLAIMAQGIQGLKEGRLDTEEQTALEEFAFRGTESGTKERGFAALENALEAGTALIGGGATARALKEITEEAGKKALSTVVKEAFSGRTGRDVASQVLVDAGIGTGFGALVTLQDEDATPADVVRNSLIGGAIGTVLPPMFEVGIRSSGLIGKSMGRQLGDVIDKGASFFERQAARGQAPELKSFIGGVKEIQPQTTANNLSGIMAKSLRSLERFPVAARRAVFKEAPIEQMTKVLKERGLLEDKDAIGLVEGFQRAQQRGAAKAQNTILGYLDNTIGKFGTEDWFYTKQYLKFLDNFERMRAGQKIPGGLSERQLTEDFLKLKNFLNQNNKLGTVQTAAKQHQRYMRGLLDEAHTVGRISTDEYKRIKNAHENYVPHQALDFLEKEAGFAGTADQALRLKFAKGSEREIADIDEAVIRTIFNEKYKNERQRAYNALFRTIEGNEDLLGVRKLETVPKAVDVPKGKELIEYWRNGVKETWEIDQDLARAIKGLGAPQIEKFINVLQNTTLGRIMTTPARTLRAVATQLSPTFALLRNPIRDAQSAQLLSRFTARDYADALMQSIHKNNPAKAAQHRQAAEAGLFLSSFLQADREPINILNQALRKRGIFGKTLSDRALTVTDAIQAAGGVMEETTRLAVFKNALQRGLTPNQAVREAANATVDFGRKGDLTQLLNQVIPFFNATVQGSLALARNVGKDPQQFLRRATTTTAYPALVLNSWNQDYDSYKNVPDWEKQMYWIIMVSETPGKDYDGNDIMIPHYIRIPKGVPQQMISGAIDHVMDVGTEEEFNKETREFLSDFASTATPIDFGQAGGLASVVPSGAKMPIELMTNYSFFRDAPIEKDWYMRNGEWFESEELEPQDRFNELTNSKLSQMLGEALNWSPAKIDYVLKTGVGTDLTLLLDLGLLTTEEQEERLSTFLGREAQGIERLRNIPGIRTFFGSNSYQQTIEANEKELEETRAANREAIETGSK